MAWWRLHGPVVFNSRAVLFKSGTNARLWPHYWIAAPFTFHLHNCASMSFLFVFLWTTPSATPSAGSLNYNKYSISRLTLSPCSAAAHFISPLSVRCNMFLFVLAHLLQAQSQIHFPLWNPPSCPRQTHTHVLWSFKRWCSPSVSLLFYMLRSHVP